MAELILHPIGVIRTPFIDKYAAPRQPGTDGESAVGKVVLEKGHNFEQALNDLNGFEKIWLIYQFDRNTNWKPKVLPPRSDIKRGVFATRSPHRPNPLGLSVVTLLEIRGRTLIVEGVDMLDKTPLFDIKPYLSATESFPEARMGWASDTVEKDNHQRTFTYDKNVVKKLEGLPFQEQHHIRAHIEKMLQFDIRPHPYKRISVLSDGSYMLAYKTLRITFSMQGTDSVIITDIRPA
ncbi:MAG TPA: tRNA (N6-threonylcarbamoyladenosine(37)-N6)-methyltransferase TrmO [Candidatus Kapabacteria bacterium]|nr:tRNA (N6-threonylcarbamoyladenosine(37)-N6)-methyltransferase TrmO [Candidatus Kapabacteria bacterium]